jgi:DNA-binding NtrC family response regulator
MAALDKVERDHVASVLAATGGHKTRAAEILEISRPRLARLIEKYDLE